MTVFGENISIQTKGFSEIRDLTDEVRKIVSRSKIHAGLVNIFPVGSTASITTIEFEPALVEDMRDKLQEFHPSDKSTRHGDTWGDDNGFSHLRASFMGPGITVPVVASGGQYMDEPSIGM